MEIILQNFLPIIKNFQRCQRNFDLKKTIDPNLVNLLIDVGLNTPTKQNLYSFKLIAVQNPNLIKQIAAAARVSPIEEKKSLYRLKREKMSRKRQGLSPYHNTQIYANLVFLYFINWQEYTSETRKQRDPSGLDLSKSTYDNLTNLEIGISVGAVGTVANSNGLRTGCCKCYAEECIPREILERADVQQEDLRLLFGIGYPLYPTHTQVTNTDDFRDSHNKYNEKFFID